MKKIKKFQDELNFILSASPAELMDYIASYPFRPKAEKPFVETAPAKAVRLYIELYGLKSSAAVVIFRENKSELVDALLAWQNDAVIMKTFLAHGDYHRIKKYVNEFHVTELPEQEVLERFDKTELQALIATGKLSAFAKYDILVRGDDELRDALLRKGPLDKRERDYVVNFSSKPIFELFMSLQENRKVFDTLNQIKLIRFAKKKVLAAYIARQRMHREAEEFFLGVASFDLLLSYVKHYHPEGGDEALLTHPDRSEILNYLSKRWLCEKGEHLLLKRGEHDEIKAYIKSHFLNPEDEIKLIKRNHHREIMLYLSRHTLSAEAQIELIYRRNQTEISYLVTTYPLTLTDETVETLKKCHLVEVLDLLDDVLMVT